MKRILFAVLLFWGTIGFPQYGIRDTFNLYVSQYNNGDITFNELNESLGSFFNTIPEDAGVSHYEKVFQRGIAFWKDRIQFDEYGNEVMDGYIRKLEAYLGTPICPNGDEANWKYHFDPSPITTQSAACNPVGGHASGIITAVYMNPSNTDIIVAGAGASGIWFTDNGGEYWTNVTDHLRVPALGINEIIDISKPSEAEGQYLVAITGTERFKDSFGAGVLKSNDFGETWTKHTIPDVDGITERLVDITAVNGESNYLFACSNRHVYYSTDRGTTWALTPEQPDITSQEEFYSIVANDLVDKRIMVSSDLKWNSGSAHLWRADFHPTLTPWEDITQDYLMAPIIAKRTINVDGDEYFEEECNFFTPIDGYSLDAFDEPDEYFPLEYEFIEGSWHIKSEPVSYYKVGIGYLAHYRTQQNLRYYFGGKDVHVQGDINVSFDGLLPYGTRIKIILDGTQVGEFQQFDTIPTYQSYSATFTSTEDNYAEFLEIRFAYSPPYDIYAPEPVYLDNIHVDFERINHEKPKAISLAEPNGLEDYVLFSTFDTLFNHPIVNGFYTNDFGDNFEQIYYELSANLGLRRTFTVSYDPVGEQDNLYLGACAFKPFNQDDSTFLEIDSRHADVRFIQIVDRILDEDVIIIGDDGGVSYSEDSGITWESLNGVHLPITQFYGIGLNQFDNKSIVGGTQDNGTFYGSNSSWAQIYGGDGGQSGFIPLEEHSNWVFYQSNNSIIVSDSATIADVYSFSNSSENMSWFLNQPIEIDPVEGLTLFTGLDTKSAGAAIARHDIDSPEEDPYSIYYFDSSTTEIGAIEIAPANNHFVYCAEGENKSGSSFLKLFLSTDWGDSFVDLTALSTDLVEPELGNPTIGKTLSQVIDKKNINAIETNPLNEGELWIGLSGVHIRNDTTFAGELRVLHSSDTGKTWQDYSLGLPPFPVNDLIFHEGSNKRLFAATDAGVFYRDASMSEWVCFQEGMPVTLTTDLEINNCTQELYAATYGRGIWKSAIDLPDAFPVVISDDLTWGGVQQFEHDIIIESGNTLTLTGTIEMAGSKHIIVEPGARLKVDGGTITNSCEVFWGGIEVHGVSSLEQTPANQGVVTLLNEATIENAEVAVALWEPGNWASTGGIIYATQSHFVNNRKSVEFVNYQNFNVLSSETVGNVSYFRNTSFTWDDAYFDDFPLGHVTMYKVDGVRFTACSFTDDRTDPESRYFVDYAKNNSGIYSIDAQYYVLPGCSDITGCSGSIDDDVDWIPTTFENLDFGVYASNTASERNIIVDRATFTNNLYGVQTVNVNTAVITRNHFDYTDTLNNFTAYTQLGIHLVRSADIWVQENEFENISAPNKVNGIVASDLGEGDEVIYGNLFTDLDNANITQGKNRYYDPVDYYNGLLGLQFQCNENTDNYRDHYILNSLWGGAPSDFYGVRREQGAVSEPSGNILSNGAIPYDGEDFENGSANNLIYHYFDGPTDPLDLQTPVEVLGYFALAVEVLENQCLTQLQDNPYQNYDGGSLSSLSSEFTTVSSALDTKTAELDGLINGGNTDSLMTEIDNLLVNNRSNLRNLLLSISPYVSEEAVKATINNPIAKYPHAWTYELITNNIEVAYEPGFIDFLSTKMDPLPQWMIDDIQDQLDTNATTMYSTKRSEIADLSFQRALAANKLLTYYKSDTTGIDVATIRYWIDEKADVLSETRIIDTYIEEGDYVNAQELVDSLDAQIQYYSDHLQDELTDYVSYKDKLIEILSNGTPLDSLSETDHTFMTDMAENGVGLARYQAQELLCFFYGECTEYPVILPQANLAPMSEPDGGLSEVEDRQFNIYPNPANDYLTIVLPNSDEPLQVTITDLTGRVVYREQVRKSLYNIDTNPLSGGNYLITVTNLNGDVNYGTQKVVIQH